MQFAVLFGNLGRMSCSSRHKAQPFIMCLTRVWMCLVSSFTRKTRRIIILCQVMSRTHVELVMVEGSVQIHVLPTHFQVPGDQGFVSCVDTGRAKFSSISLREGDSYNGTLFHLNNSRGRCSSVCPTSFLWLTFQVHAIPGEITNIRIRDLEGCSVSANSATASLGSGRRESHTFLFLLLWCLFQRKRESPGPLTNITARPQAFETMKSIPPKVHLTLEQTTRGLGASTDPHLPPSSQKSVCNFGLPKNITTNSLLLTGSPTHN